MEKMNTCKKILNLIIKMGIVLGVMVGFYKIPPLIAEKISYKKIKSTPIKQEFSKEE